VSPEFVNFFMNRTGDQAEADQHSTARAAPTGRLARAVRRAVLPAFLHARWPRRIRAVRSRRSTRA